MRLFFLLAILISSVNAHAQKIIEISNPSSLARKDEVIEIPLAKVTTAFPTIDTSNFKVISPATKQELEYQLEYKSEANIQNLLVQVSIPANGKIKLQLIKGKHKPFISKTFCRFVPERKDDFAWENDKIAFRMYGKALEKTPNEMAYGVDVWVKRTSRLIINDRYKRGEYHVDHGDGMDYYHVGLTLGAGGCAPYMDDSIWFSKNYTGWKVLDNGPLRSTFQLSYDDWTAAGIKVNVVKTISIDAGSQLNKVVANYTIDENKALPFVTGIIKRKEQGQMLLDEKNGIMAYWEPQHGADGTTGVACVMPSPVAQMMVKQGQLLAQLMVEKPYSLVYFQGAAWDKAGTIKSAEDWFNYLKKFQEQLKNKLTITIK